MTFQPIRVRGNRVEAIDQTLLPNREVWFSISTLEEAARAIVTMQVRGAPLIGITAAYAVALEAGLHRGRESEFVAAMQPGIVTLGETRPTAVNLFWALDRMGRRIRDIAALPAPQRVRLLWQEAEAIQEEDLQMCLAMGKHGADLVKPGETLMTHCNAGALATGGHGTALGVIRTAHARYGDIRVLARETRPRLQGARLTAWELQRDGIPVTVVPDGAAAHLMAQGRVQRIFVGADRIAANGDSANKIGTYDLAIIARYHGIPFHIVAPHSTVDLSLASGVEIPIEERSQDEVSVLNSERLVPEGVPAVNPAFDVTPASLIDSIITEAGVATAPYVDSLARLLEGKR